MLIRERQALVTILDNNDLALFNSEKVIIIKSFKWYPKYLITAKGNLSKANVNRFINKYKSLIKN